MTTPATTQPLNPHFFFEPTRLITSATRWKICYRTVAIVIAIASVALAAYSAPLVWAFYSKHFVLYIVCSTMISYKLYSACQRLWTKAEFERKLAEDLETIAKRIAHLTSEEIHLFLQSWKIDPSSIEISAFRPIIGRYLAMEDILRSYSRKTISYTDTQRDLAQKPLSQIDLSDPKQRADWVALQNGKLSYHLLQRAIAKTKFETAFLLYLMKNPYQAQASLKDRVTIYEEGENSWNLICQKDIFARFNHSSTTCTTEEIASSDIGSVYERLFPS